MADFNEEYGYLSRDPNSITVPELRSILLKHGVTYPSSAKKPVLVGLFNEKVLPQAAKLQRAAARTKRSTRGIEDVPSSQASTTTDDADEDETLLAPPPSSRRSSRRTTRAATEEADQTAPRPRGKTPSRAVPAKHSRATDADVDEQPAARRNRKSMVPAVIKQDSAEPEAWHQHDVESPFTQDNPFQSGSSPALPASKDRERRRKTMGFEHKEKRKSDVARRRTLQPNAEQYDDGIVVPSRKTFDMPVSRVTREQPAQEWDGVEPGEEFTPEEEQALVQEQARTGSKDVLPQRRRKQTSQTSSTLQSLFLTILALGAASFGGVWRQEKLAVGFCGVGEEPTSLAGVEVPEWASFVLPQCEQCPPHAAYCEPNLGVVCEQDFILKPHPLSLGGMIPLAPTCEPDSAKARRITAVSDKTVQILRERRAKFECGEADADGKIVESAEVPEAELKQEVSSIKRKGMSQEEFDNLWKSAIGEIVGRDEIEEKASGFAAAATDPATEPSPQHPSPSSPSLAASSDPSDKQFNDIFNSLL